MKAEKFKIEFERDPKTRLLTGMSLPSDLPLEQRILILVPFIESLQEAIEKLETSTRRYSKILMALTTVLVALTVVLIGLSAANLASNQVI